MTINIVSPYSRINFKENPNADTEKVTNSIKSDYEKSPETDTFENNDKTTTNTDLESEQTVEQKKQPKEGEQKEKVAPKKKKHTARNIIIGVIALPVLIYGGVVLKHKLSKPTFEEIQKSFKEIFGKDLSKEEVNNLLDKYKQLLKNNNTEDFAKQMIEQLKKDYGIAKVETEVNIELLKDGKLKTAIEHTNLGSASPLAKINIMPRTNSDVVARGQQKEIFNTGFHELKHLKQFSDAYRANPDKFVDAIYEHNITKDAIEEGVKNLKAELKKQAENLLKEEVFKGKSLSEVEKILEKEFFNRYKTYEDCFAAQTKKAYKEMLDKRFGKLELYKEGTEEYKKGMEYIDAYEKYPDPNKDYNAYRNNLLEKEAWSNGDLSGKIYKYLKSIWAI